jgi:hypothetical protein
MTTYTYRQDQAIRDAWGKKSAHQVGKGWRPRRTAAEIQARAAELGIPPLPNPRIIREKPKPEPVKEAQIDDGYVRISKGVIMDARSYELYQEALRS